MTKRVLRKQVSEKMKIYFMGVLFIVLTIGIINACNIWQGEAVKKDFYNHIPAIQVYQSNSLLGDNILISTRNIEKPLGIGSFSTEAKGEDIKSYYETELIKSGWEKGIDKNGTDYHTTNGKNKELFNYSKEGYVVRFTFWSPMDKPIKDIVFRIEDRRYSITIYKIESKTTV